MGRKKDKEGLEISVNGKRSPLLENLMNGDQEEKSISIIAAEIKDDLCNYSYEVLRGVGHGESHGVKSPHIIDDDMRKAFAVFNVHMAVIDDVFKHSGIEIEDIDTMHGHELTGYYQVTGFKIKGGSEDESIILIGNKYVSAGGRMKIESLKIPLDNLSSYKWKNELKAASDKAREEVELYRGGKYTEVEREDEEEGKGKLKQLTIMDQTNDGEVLEDSDHDFESAQV